MTKCSNCDQELSLIGKSEQFHYAGKSHTHHSTIRAYSCPNGHDLAVVHRNVCHRLRCDWNKPSELIADWKVRKAIVPME